MKKIKVLDCTLRDGGYVNNWNFSKHQIETTINSLSNANVDFIEFGFITSVLGNVGGTQFPDIQTASSFIPTERKNTKYLVMADVAQYDIDSLSPRTSNTIDGIRVVFYKRQVEQAMEFCHKIEKKGYDLFIQPMVTLDYTKDEYYKLIKRFYNKCKPAAVSIVDSFGCMTPNELLTYVDILGNGLDDNVDIGFHGHENMQLSQINAISLIESDVKNEIILDATVNGMGRGAGNLCTELITNYLNIENNKYNINYIFHVASEVTEPIREKNEWGYSTYFMLTALKRAHPNFATYLLEKHNVSVDDFMKFLDLIPEEMYTKCTRPYVEEIYAELIK